MSILDSLDLQLKPALEPEPGSPDWSKPSRAVVASDGDNGWVMFMVGPHIEMMCEDACGSRELDQIGLTCAAGIHVWEGVLSGGNRNYWGDYDDVELSGKFREPDEHEWGFIRRGLCPWDPDEWIILAVDERDA